MSDDGFRRAAAHAIDAVGPARVRALADGIVSGPRVAVPSLVPAPGFPEAARAVLTAQEQAGLSDAEAAAYLRGLAAGYAQHADTQRVESVWTGPASHAVPVRATAQVLVDVVAQASAELLLMTYSAKPHPPLLTALGSALGRGVVVDVVVETLQGAGGALAGAEPAAAFASPPGLRLWQWPPAVRPEPGAKMHAKLAVADRRILLVSSANLTSSGVGTNIEAGVLVHGGTAAGRRADGARRPVPARERRMIVAVISQWNGGKSTGQVAPCGGSCSVTR